ncbi:GNAT family N-acetyltransferase [Vulcaniibacterium tengchongense]|uniref:RimJ/RimL family protein N-acetyltransferase n=1 Tax=Vulcaniibacterium tengchongense TaxID=1273429 RepID=A0A3N4UV44_9GAMM|nr:GNAT family protein [Vulcaniibacterium tengchongense]RPE74602.1 RimJ/RimL family protein N-acetyltransferase [Vulcaniibacterium tengchongense]
MASLAHPYRGVVLRGDGFVLRAWRDDDLDALLRHADDAEVARGLGERFPHPYTRADGERFLAGEVIDPSEPAFAIEVDGQACGGIGAHPGLGERRRSAEFGYWLGRALWGRGLMTRVVAAFAPWAIDALGLYRLQASVHVGNPASARVLEKNGFEREGVLRCAVVKHGEPRDLLLYAKVRRSLDDAP